jgi:hypothetical protein
MVTRRDVGQSALSGLKTGLGWYTQQKADQRYQEERDYQRGREKQADVSAEQERLRSDLGATQEDVARAAERLAEAHGGTPDEYMSQLMPALPGPGAGVAAMWEALGAPTIAHLPPSQLQAFAEHYGIPGSTPLDSTNVSQGLIPAVSGAIPAVTEGIEPTEGIEAQAARPTQRRSLLQSVASGDPVDIARWQREGPVSLSPLGGPPQIAGNMPFENTTGEARLSPALQTLREGAQGVVEGEDERAVANVRERTYAQLAAENKADATFYDQRIQRRFEEETQMSGVAFDLWARQEEQRLLGQRKLRELTHDQQRELSVLQAQLRGASDIEWMTSIEDPTPRPYAWIYNDETKAVDAVPLHVPPGMKPADLPLDIQQLIARLEGALDDPTIDKTQPGWFARIWNSLTNPPLPEDAPVAAESVFGAQEPTAEVFTDIPLDAVQALLEEAKGFNAPSTPTRGGSARRASSTLGALIAEKKAPKSFQRWVEGVMHDFGLSIEEIGSNPVLLEGLSDLWDQGYEVGPFEAPQRTRRPTSATSSPTLDDRIQARVFGG